MKVIVDGLAVNYQTAGQGKAVLLLHGWGDNLETFNSLVKKLAQQYQTIALDLPGFGATQPPKEVWNLDNYAQFLAAFLGKIEVKPYAIIGHSNGGALAIRTLSLGLVKADKLVLLAASGVRDNNTAKRQITKLIAKAGKTVTFWLPHAQKQQLRKKLYGTIGSDLLVAPHLQETFKQTVRQDVQADAASLILPTLLIFADQDPAIPLSDGQRYHELIKNSKLEVLNCDDHFVHHVLAEQVERLIKDFI